MIAPTARGALCIGLLLASGSVRAEEPAPLVPKSVRTTPVLPSPAPPSTADKPFPALSTVSLQRVVPKDEMRTIGFYTYLFPDCSPQGPIVARLLTKPAHGTVRFEESSSYGRFAPNTPLSACSEKRVTGLRVQFEAAEGYEGLDAFRMLIINPDGTAFEVDGRVSIR
jgi:hypothetical protein